MTPKEQINGWQKSKTGRADAWRRPEAGLLMELSGHRGRWSVVFTYPVDGYAASRAVAYAKDKAEARKRLRECLQTDPADHIKAHANHLRREACRMRDRLQRTLADADAADALAEKMRSK